MTVAELAKFFNSLVEHGSGDYKVYSRDDNGFFVRTEDVEVSDSLKAIKIL